MRGNVQVILGSDQCARGATQWHDGQISGHARIPVKCQASAATIVIARSESDEAIQIVSAKKFWIASLRSQ
jgi:hypothetical protein